MTQARLLAVDPSLSCSGWALFDVSTARLMGVGKVRSLPPTSTLAMRLSDLQRKIVALFDRFTLGQSDLLVCEAETTMKDPRAMIKQERVRGVFETVARERQLLVPGRMNPRTVQSELMGLKGAQAPRAVVKECALHTAKALFGKALTGMGFETSLQHLKRHQDIVDALLIGNLALTRVHAARVAGISLDELFEARRWRRRTSRAGWGKGEANSFGWSAGEIEELVNARR